MPRAEALFLLTFRALNELVPQAVHKPSWYVVTLKSSERTRVVKQRMGWQYSFSSTLNFLLIMDGPQDPIFCGGRNQLGSELTASECVRGSQWPGVTWLSSVGWKTWPRNGWKKSNRLNGIYDPNQGLGETKLQWEHHPAWRNRETKCQPVSHRLQHQGQQNIQTWSYSGVQSQAQKAVQVQPLCSRGHRKQSRFSHSVAEDNVCMRGLSRFITTGSSKLHSSFVHFDVTLQNERASPAAKW